jgi:hypothetical protein
MTAVQGSHRLGVRRIEASKISIGGDREGGRTTGFWRIARKLGRSTANAGMELFRELLRLRSQ